MALQGGETGADHGQDGAFDGGETEFDAEAIFNAAVSGVDVPGASGGACDDGDGVDLGSGEIGGSASGDSGSVVESLDAGQSDNALKKDGDAFNPGDLDQRFKTLEQQVHDNKAWATRVAQENAELKKQLSVKPEGSGPEGETAKDEVIPDELREYYATDPMLQKAVAFEAERLVKQRFGDFDPRSIDQRISVVNESIEQANFERAVMVGVVTPKGFVNGHPDAIAVLSTTDYQTWFETEAQRDPAIRSVSDAVAAIGIMDRYKASVAEKAAQNSQAAQHGAKKQMADMMSGAVDKGNKAASERAKDDKNLSPEEAFDEGIK